MAIHEPVPYPRRDKKVALCGACRQGTLGQVSLQGGPAPLGLSFVDTVVKWSAGRWTDTAGGLTYGKLGLPSLMATKCWSMGCWATLTMSWNSGQPNSQETENLYGFTTCCLPTGTNIRRPVSGLTFCCHVVSLWKNHKRKIVFWSSHSSRAQWTYCYVIQYIHRWPHRKRSLIDDRFN